MSVSAPADQRREALMELVRYTVVAVLGLGVDVGIGYGARRLLGMPLVAGAALGFLVGVAFNYVLFEFWVFRYGRLTWLRLGKAYAASQGAIVVRLGCVWALGRLLAGLPQADLIVLVGAAGISFVVNFILTRLFLRKKST
ncbi:GtrA family protein [Novosphingobium sp. KACC 22771]|uniref:GtrA family protein n=1 Tax=Novosphingobium sp. KACC 22771 TaxID=3025670 RepID=UPI0023650892|nr:GtrA family protein [Novosphingobium sp. KACC 22771]WDF72864.1 GtrA family protein [Novosphingobium sp. KACC 22771]